MKIILSANISLFLVNFHHTSAVMPYVNGNNGDRDFETTFLRGENQSSGLSDANDQFKFSVDGSKSKKLTVPGSYRNHENQCQDFSGSFDAGTRFGIRDCLWLDQNFGRFRYLCQYLPIAYECRALCDSCSYFEKSHTIVAPSFAPTTVVNPPTSVGGGDIDGGFCFSGKMMLQVEDMEGGNKLKTSLVSMENLKIGDKIRVGQGEEDYSLVYSFGHYDTDTVVEYLQLHHGGQLPLEITKDHMVKVKGRGFVPASTIIVGDELVLDDENLSSKIVNIDTVRRKGAYAPFTESGTIVVNNVVASNYISIQPANEHTVNGNFMGIPNVSMQWIAHSSQAYHRLICKFIPKFCANETFESGISKWVRRPYIAAKWIVSQRKEVFSIIAAPLIMAAAVSNLIEISSLGIYAAASWRDFPSSCS